MNINEYRDYLINECIASAKNNETTADDEFITYITELFEQNEEVLNLNKSYFEMIGKGNRKIQIDGWGYDEADQSFILFYSKFDTSPELSNLLNSDIEKYIKCLEAFIENSINNYIQENVEFSSEGRGIASTLRLYYFNNTISKFKFYIITNNPLSKYAKAPTKEKILDKDVKIEIWDLERIYRSDINNQQKEDISIDCTEYVKGGLKCIKAFEEENEEYIAYLAVIPGTMLADLYDKYGSSLLEGNVRSFLSATSKVNKGIKNTIENQPTYFFTYNNGIATTAKSVTLSNDGNAIDNIVNLQIINGGQTTASIFFTKYNDKNNIVDLTKVFIPMKLTVVKKDDKYAEIIEKISRYSNTQNKVSDADFFSNSKFHTEFKKYSESIFTPIVKGQLHSTKWFYERARGSYKQEQLKMSKSEQNKFKSLYPKDQLITKTDLAKYYNCYLCLPYIVSKGAQYNMKNFAEYYEKYLKNNINEKFYKDCISLAILFRQTDKLLQKQSWFPKGSGYKANIVAYSISKLFDSIQNKYAGKKSLDFEKIWNEQSLYPELAEYMMIICHNVEASLTSKDRGIVNVTEWAKKEDCWKKIQALDINIPLDLEITLTSLENENEKKANAKKQKRFNDNMDNYVKVVKLGSDFWAKVAKDCIAKKIPINVIQQNDLKIAVNMSNGKRIPNSFEAKRLMQFLNFALDNGLTIDVDLDNI